ncbi:ABC transporter ATP-binding protein [Rhodococcoides yunnanense]|uniref:ABC transporter ATP-binding protein n=1 Tax=Rhodococcoides yunnanense TaxID=278209 RepID=UPI00093331BA|nr:ABC transporter ATP-binding protein [Rhodococcus yunnanensis]
MTIDGPDLLDVRKLTVVTAREKIPLVQSVSFAVARGSVHALVGQSGSGKSTILRAIDGVLPRGLVLESGSVAIDGVDTASLSPRDYRLLRGRTVGFVPQDPAQSLNPTMTVGATIRHALRSHHKLDRTALRRRTIELLGAAQLPRAASRLSSYPHELSGGLKQRVLIAVALAGQPSLILADEPTSALDTTVQKRILDTLDQLASDHGLGLLLVTHDLAIAADRAEQVTVLLGGHVAESGATAAVLDGATHPFTRELLRASSYAVTQRSVEPDWSSGPRAVVCSAHEVSKSYDRSLDASDTQWALRECSLDIEAGETVGLIGESGSGKSTLGKIISGTLEPSRGTLSVGHVAYIPQNPDATLDPRWTIARSVAEPLRLNKTPSTLIPDLVDSVLNRVGLDAEAVSGVRPHQLSGGQRQRVAVARALVTSPALIVCDEILSALDAGSRSTILDLLVDLRNDTGVAYLFITHDLSIARAFCTRLAVMHDGSIVDNDATAAIFESVRSPHTRELVEAIPGFANAEA